MASFLRLDENNIVIQAVALDDSMATTEDIGIAYLKSLHGIRGDWIQTYQDGTRKNYGGLGYTYNESKDAFISPQPYPSWILNEDTCKWEAPIVRPTDVDERKYIWDEENTEWKERV